MWKYLRLKKGAKKSWKININRSLHMGCLIVIHSREYTVAHTKLLYRHMIYIISDYDKSAVLCSEKFV